MQTNFTLVDHYALKINEEHFDLHNDFDFVSFHSTIAEKNLILNWKKNSGEWVANTTVTTLSMMIKDVDYLLITPRDFTLPVTEDTCLVDMTFYPQTERTDHTSLLRQESPTPQDDMIFTFQGGQIIRVHRSAMEVILT